MGQAEKAAHDTYRQIIENGKDTIAGGLKADYLSLKAAVEARLGANTMPEAEESPYFNGQIYALTDEVLSAKTVRAKTIHEEAAKAGIAIPTGEQLHKTAEAGAKARHANTGSFEFLGGSTILNAIAGLFQWIFSGCEGGFAGLKKTIATRAGQNTKEDFTANLDKSGIKGPLREKAIAGFGTEVDRVIAGKPESKPFSLADVPIKGFDPEAAAAQKKANEENAQNVTENNLEETLTTQFSSIADNALALPGIPDTMQATVTAAKSAFAEEGAQLALINLQNNTSITNDAFQRQVLINTLNNVKTQNASIEAFNTLLKDGTQSLDDIQKKLSKDNSILEGKGGILLAAMCKEFAESTPQLVIIAKKVAPTHPDAIGADDIIAQAEADKQKAEAARTGALRSQVLTMVNLNTQDIRAEIDAGIEQRIATLPTDPDKLGGEWAITRLAKAATNKVAKNVGAETFGELTGHIPDDDERNALATLIATQVPAIAAKIVTDKFSTNQPMQAGKLAEEIANDFVDNTLNASTSGDLQFWRENSNMVRTMIREKATEQLQKNLEKLGAEQASHMPLADKTPDFDAMIKQGPRVATNAHIATEDDLGEMPVPTNPSNGLPSRRNEATL